MDSYIPLAWSYNEGEGEAILNDISISFGAVNLYYVLGALQLFGFQTSELP